MTGPLFNLFLSLTYTGEIMSKINISLFDTIRTTTPSKKSVSMGNFIKSMSTPSSNGHKSKSELPLWSPTVFNGRRSGANAIEVSCVVFDMDDGLSPFESWKKFKQAGYTVIAHTSASHKIDHPKYRVILPLETPIPAEDWAKAWRAGVELWMVLVGAGAPDDKAIKDVARVYYRYAIPKSDLSEDDYHHPSKIQESASYSGFLLDLEYSHIQIPQIVHTPIKRNEDNTPVDATLRDAMMDTTLRYSIALQSGQISGNNCKFIICPGCNRESVYFSIDINIPNATKYPTCNHRNTCGWWGQLHDLI